MKETIYSLRLIILVVLLVKLVAVNYDKLYQSILNDNHDTFNSS
jgi:hypothetical protein